MYGVMIITLRSAIVYFLPLTSRLTAYDNVSIMCNYYSRPRLGAAAGLSQCFFRGFVLLNSEKSKTRFTGTSVKRYFCTKCARGVIGC